MRRITMLPIWTSLLIAIGSMAAQTVTGYSSLDWDAASSTLTGISGTEISGDASIYYSSYVNAKVTDQNGNVLASRANEDDLGDGSISVTLRVTGAANTTYTLIALHEGLVTYSCGGGAAVAADAAGGTTLLSPGCGGSSGFDDYYNFESYTGDDGYPEEWNWFGPGPAQTTPTRAIPIGQTFDVVDLTTPSTFGDERDQLAAEYITYKAPIRPPCTVFNNHAQTISYTFSQLNYPSPMTAPALYDWALFTRVFLSNVESWNETWIEDFSTVPLHIDSGYRCPSQNQQALGKPNSQHMRGDAADMANVTGDLDGRNRLISALTLAGLNPGFVEPINGVCALGCVHADWRNASQQYFPQ